MTNASPNSTKPALFSYTRPQTEAKNKAYSYCFLSDGFESRPKPLHDYKRKADE